MDLLDLSTEIKEIKEYATLNNVPIMQDEGIDFLTTLIIKKQIKNILEIGTAIGYSALNFSRHLTENGKIYTVELNPDTAQIAKNNIKSFNMEEKIHVIIGDGEQEMEKLVCENKVFDVVFIDAAKGQYVKYLNLALKLCKKGSVIIADNVLFKGRVLSDYNEHKHRTAVNRLREYLKEIEESEILQTSVLDVGDGVAISVVKG